MCLVRLNNQVMQMACQRNDETVGNDETEEMNASAFKPIEGNEDVFDCVLSDRANFSEKVENYLVMGVTRVAMLRSFAKGASDGKHFLASFGMPRFISSPDTASASPLSCRLIVFLYLTHTW